MLRPSLALVLLASAVVFAAQPDAPKKKKAETAGSGSRAAMAQLTEATPPSAIQVAPGFKVELLYAVPKGDQGSWVALTIDPKGRILASDQYGGIYRLTLPPIGTSTRTKVEHLAIDFTTVKAGDAGAPPTAEPKKKADIGPKMEVGAHGLLYAFDSLYVMVN